MTENGRGRRVSAPWLVRGGRFCLLLASLGLPTGCHRGILSVPKVSVETEISPQPVTVGPAEIIVKLADADGKPLTRATVNVEGDMSHAGMSPVFADATALPDGVYRAHLAFAMAGDWVVLLHIKLPGGETLERQVDVRGVRAN